MLAGITGASGFVGRRLVAELLGAGIRVRVLTRTPQHGFPPGVEVCIADLIHSELGNLALFTKNLDILFHCAGEIKNPLLMEALHLGGTRNLIEVARGSVGRWVQLSSVGAYGSPTEGIINEKSPERPKNLYEITKTASDHLVLDASNKGAFQAILLRPSSIIGPEMPNQSVYQLLKTIKDRRYFFIGPPGATRNYIHVADVANALHLAAVHPTPAEQVYNLSNCCQLEDLVAWASKTLEVERQIPRLPLLPVKLASRILSVVPGFPLTPSRVKALTSRCIYSTEAIQRDFNFRIQYPTNKAIKELCLALQERCL